MGTNHIQCTALVSTSKVFWNVIHCWERKSELTCYFLSCLLMHWLGKKLISLQSHPPIKVSVLSPALSASWEKGKTKILKKLLKTVKKRRNLIFTPSLHVYNKAYAFNGSIWSGISINLGPKKKNAFCSATNQSAQMKETVNVFYQTEPLCLWTNIRAKEINQAHSDGRASKCNLHWWLLTLQFTS